MSLRGRAGLSTVEKTQSADGTTIAFDRYGDGPPLVFVMGAVAHRAISPGIAELAARAGTTVLAYDRRGRGDSGDTPPYAVAREIEDLAAVIDAAGGEAAVFGHSSGAVLALDAAAAGLPITRLALYEAPVAVDGDPPGPRDWVARLAAADGPEARLEMFWTEAVGMPAQQVAGMKAAPVWPVFVSVGDTVLHDARIMDGLVDGAALPADRWAGVTAPALVMAGGASGAAARNGARAIAAVLPDARVSVLDGQGHVPAWDALGRALRPLLGH